MTTDHPPRIPTDLGEPAWEVAQLLPPQGHWSESDFLSLHTNRMAELVNGRLEVLPMPNWLHQLIVDFFVQSIRAHLTQTGRGGVVLFAPLPTRLFPGTIREPDVLYVSPEHLPSDPAGYPDKLDFVVEVVSSGAEAHRRDYDEKRHDYAQAGIAEYWIVDPQQRLITVLALEDDHYQTWGVYRESEQASGRYFNSFSVDVSAVFSLADRQV
jgi:Uma2 family endonuclease